MPIRITCPGCKKPLLVPDQLAGKKVRCKVCAGVIVVPANGAPASILPVSRPPVARAAGSPPAGAKPGKPVAKPGAKPGGKPVLKSKPADLEALAAASLGLDEKPSGNGSANGTNGAHADNGANGSATADAKPPIKFNCSFCDEEVTLEASQAGKQVPCPACTRIVRVPMPKETKPKDWRTVEKKGPSAAVANLPEKLDNAWGTEANAKVSQKALIEAGVVAKAPKKKAPLDERIARWVKRGLLAAVIVGVGTWLYVISRPSVQNAKFAEIEQDYKRLDLEAKWPPLSKAEYHRLMGEWRLRMEGAAEKARDKFVVSRDALSHPADAKQPADTKQKLDRDFYLLELARTQVELGGSEKEVFDKNRLGWDRDVPIELLQTLNHIENLETHLLALCVLKQPLQDRKQDQVLQYLTAELNRGAAKIELGPQIDAVEKARQGKLDEALKPAKDKKQDPAKRFEIAVAVLTFLREEAPDKTEELKTAHKLALDIATNDLRDRVPNWSLLQLIRVTVRSDEAEQAPKLIEKFREKKDKGYERRAKFEIQLARLEKAPSNDEAAAIVAEVEPDGQGFAWLTWARACDRNQKSFQGPEADEKHFDFLLKTRRLAQAGGAPK